MRRSRQPALPGLPPAHAREFGGSLLRGNPRHARPVAPRHPLHVVLRATRARGPLSLLSPRRARPIEALTRRLARAQGVRLYRYANAGNHLHLVVLPGSRRALSAFLRALSGLVARQVLGAERGRPSRVQGRDGSTASPFWDARPFTRIVAWGRDFTGLCSYVALNELEATGFVAARPRKKRPP